VIVEDPPYDLVALFACSDSVSFLTQVIERGQASRCLRPIRWRRLRDPMRKDQLCQAPEQTLRPFVGKEPPRFLVVWDHAGSGRETAPAREVEANVRLKVAQCGVPDSRVLAIAFEPELEAVLSPVWRSAVELLAAVRQRPAPEDDAIVRRVSRHGVSTLPAALERFPKETVEAVVALLQLRRSPALYQTLGEKLSMPALKTGAAVERLTKTLVGWFPP
jgi:hypothetical protein